jgi:hypothetical protein
MLTTLLSHSSSTQQVASVSLRFTVVILIATHSICEAITSAAPDNNRVMTTKLQYRQQMDRPCVSKDSHGCNRSLVSL